MCKKLVLCASLVMLLGLSNITFADELIFKMDFSCPDQPLTKAGGTWIDLEVAGGCDDDRHDPRYREDVNGTDIDVRIGNFDGHGNVIRRVGDPISNTSWDSWYGCGDNVIQLEFRDLDPYTSYSLYTYHAWDDGDINSITIVGADANNIVTMPVVLDTTDDDVLLNDPNVGVIEFTTGPVEIVDGNVVDGNAANVQFQFSGCVRLNAFALNLGVPKAASPNPSNEGLDVCPDSLQLSWAPVEDSNNDVYVGTDYDAVADATRSVKPGVLWSSENQDSNTYTIPVDLVLDTTYYWRVDTVIGEEILGGAYIWSFTTEDGNARYPSPFDYQVGWPPDANVLKWTPACVATSQDVYFSTNFDDVNEMQIAAYQDTLIAGANSIGVTLDIHTTYYWRVKTTGSGTDGDGEVWRFGTGFGGVVMYYNFNGFADTNLPSPIEDDSGNEIEFYTITSGSGSSVKYGEPNPVVIGATSAEFTPDPNAGLYRNDTGFNDPLLMAYPQYTIEMWFKVDEGSHGGNDMVLIGKGGDDSESWSISLSDISDDDDFRWYHRGEDLQVGGMMEDMLDEWIHVAAVYDQSLDEERKKLYINGELRETGNDERLNPADDNSPVYIGMGEDYEDGEFDGYDGFLEGMIDELRILDIALAPCEFLLRPGLEYAGCPIPFLGQRMVDPNAVLKWGPGTEATSHEVYLSLSYDDVLNATTDTAGVYLGSADVNHHPFDSNLALEPGKMYYWRVDERNGGLYTGTIWRFETTSAVFDPNLRVWYKFDEESGDDVADYSGRYNEGEIDGDEEDWDPNDGRFDGSLGFNNDTAVDCTEGPGPESGVLDTIGTSISVSIWLKDAYRAGSDNWVFSSRTGPNTTIVKAAVVEDGTLDVLWRAGDSNDVLRWDLDGANPRLIEGWHHWVFRKDEIADTMSIYFDSVEVASRSDVNDTLVYIKGHGFRLGVDEDSGDDFIGRMDDARVYDKALSEDEIMALFRGGDRGQAWAPQPYDGAGEVPIDTGLVWEPGDFAGSHDIYFGTDYDDVDNATTATAGIFIDNQGPNTYTPGALFEFGEVYYWRIDEVNDACDPNGWKGNVWSFTAASFIVIDDFESYNDIDNVIYDTWEDGVTNLNSSSVIWLGTEPNVHGGDQAVEFLYENQKDWWSGHYWSEIVREYDTAQDWTLRDTRILTLYFKGKADNAAGPTEEMFVAVEDAGTTKAVVKYNGYGDANDVKIEDWTEWNIILSDFTNVDMNNVKIIWIGFGDPDSQPTPGGTGTVYFDDIRLYPPKCIAEFGPLADLSGNCVVDYLDVEIMGEEWLRTDKLFDTYTEPSPGPVGHWKLNEGSGAAAADDGSGNNDGVVEGNYDWVTGYDGNSAIDFEAGRVLVPDAAALRPTNTVTVCAWINLDDEQSNARVVVKGPDNDESYLLETNSDNYLKFLIREDCPGNDCNDYFVDNEGLSVGEWAHVAGTFDSAWMKLYINGDKVAESNDANNILLSQDTNDLGIGNRSDAADKPFVGTIDDVRVYDYALSDTEIAYVATDGDGHLPLKSIANLSNTESPGSEAVNLRDFAVLGDAWLDEKLWP